MRIIKGKSRVRSQLIWQSTQSIVRRWVLLSCPAFLTLLWSSSLLSAPPSILVFGDSLSAAYGLSSEHGWVTLLQKRLQAQGSSFTVVNRSLSGETTHGGLQRLPRVLQQVRPSIVVLQLGANDGLRGLSLSQAEANLRKMIALSRQQGAKVILVGITLPPNFGSPFIQRFESIYTGLQKSEAIPLVPLLIEGFADKLEFFQSDQIHPNAVAQPLMLENIWRVLWPVTQTLSQPPPPRRASGP